ncbi:uncharacterized protein LOC142538744 [Primulina tabacum]|uniref:uncharacterized protein LOC142538744 n=1 Tax=Primulina tabacum TaxID=48773 RepID=UPI003F590786
MARTESRLDSMETHMGNMGATMKYLETQIGQLANALRYQNRGQFPSNTEVNPREQCKAVTLRSEEPKKVLEQQPLPKVNLPYPQRFKKKGIDDQFVKFLEIFKKIHINIPFADALEQMPNYAKFIKDVMSKKRKLQEFETVKLTEECNAILQRKPPQKLKEPGSFTITCVWTLELGKVKPSTITLQLADRSLTYPRGIVEDVLVKVDKFIFPVDFVILDMEEDQKTPLIFGRPFLASGKALIDVHKGELTLRIGGEEVVFNVYNTIRGPNEVSYSPNVDHQRRLNPAMKEVVRAEVLKLLNAGVIYAISDSSWVSPVQMLDRVGGYHYYCFLDGYSGYNQIVIAPEDQEKTTFTCPYGTFAFRRMPFRLCNAPATFQRCMMPIFSDMVEEIMEVFMDDISVFGSSFDHCL